MQNLTNIQKEVKNRTKNSQQKIIKEVLEGKDILTVMPTGGGKSLCYQLPATLFDGLTLVVSPLIALMQSQVAQLQLLGIKAYCLNSSNSDDENKKIIEMLKSNQIKLLYIAPERLIKNDTIDLLKTKNVVLEFSDDEIDTIANIASEVNTTVENIGARRLHTIIEKILDEISFTATDRSGEKIIINKEYINKNLDNLVKDTDLSKFIL